MLIRYLTLGRIYDLMGLINRGLINGASNKRPTGLFILDCLFASALFEAFFVALGLG